MNPVLSEMSDENYWWLSKFFVLKEMGKEYMNMFNKALWPAKDELFHKDLRK